MKTKNALVTIRRALNAAEADRLALIGIRRTLREIVAHVDQVKPMTDDLRWIRMKIYHEAERHGGSPDGCSICREEKY